MIKFQGRQSMKQCMPLKPIKGKYKVWVRVDDNGYISIYILENQAVAQNMD